MNLLTAAPRVLLLWSFAVCPRGALRFRWQDFKCLWWVNNRNLRRDAMYGWRTELWHAMLDRGSELRSSAAGTDMVGLPGLSLNDLQVHTHPYPSLALTCSLPVHLLPPYLPTLALRQAVYLEISHDAHQPNSNSVELEQWGKDRH